MHGIEVFSNAVTCVCTYVCMYACVCIYVRIYVHKYIHTCLAIVTFCILVSVALDATKEGIGSPAGIG